MSSELDKPRCVQKSPAEREDELLTAATRIFAEFGYHKADVQLVADSAGVGKGTVYRYFASKQILFMATLKYNVDILRARMEETRSRHQDPLENLRETVRGYLAYFEANPDVIELFVQERAEFREKFHSSYFLYAEEDMGKWIDLFEQIAERYPLRVDILDAMEVCGDLMHGAVLLSRAPLPRALLSQRCDRLFEILLGGVLAQ